MADEFIAKLNDASDLLLRKIKEKLILTEHYIIERDSGEEIALRFSNKDRRSKWPEDFTLNQDGQSLLLTVHSATKQERDDLIRDIESVLKESGFEISFEEI